MEQEVYVIRNQQGAYWSKGKEWVDGRDARQVARYRHHDEAVNTLVELSSKNVELRGRIEAAALSERGEPTLKPAPASAA
ncbi:hypothetical protein [Pseudohaliea rubra]|uniref:Uncharacterized protein n=1 Tax=Pseudohaliea rubra DSM 19751 TaxID=1265313 RepID=A0A095VVH0_9GAMM|nr:hypothetical protein [Pseudohaliea rubra]KGE05360.1 hypothetical protein HRUBRA_00040 [Pseudohaliea rubra DSM 19751]